MLLIAVMVIAFVILAWKSFFKGCWDILDAVAETFFFAFFTLLIFLAGAGLTFGIGAAVPKHWVQTDEVQLVSLRNTTGVSGTFVLGTGTVGTSEYYFFNKEAGEGFIPGKISTGDNVIVFEGNRKTAFYKEYTRKFPNKHYYLVALVWPSKKYEFFIPNGTLKRDFRLE